MDDTSKVYGRAFIYDTGDPPDVEFWCHDFEPMEGRKRSNAEWAHEHFCECLGEKALRDMFGLPPDGCQQVLFAGHMRGWKCNSPMDPDEWDQEFEVVECQWLPVAGPRGVSGDEVAK